MDLNILPPLCRADNVEARSIELNELREKERAKAERACGPGSARGQGAGAAPHHFLLDRGARSALFQAVLGEEARPLLLADL